MNSKLLTLLLLLAVSHLNALADLRGGIAVRTVNPDPLLPLSGGIGAGRMATRMQGDLTVRALVLEQEGTLVGIVSADFLGFPSTLGNQVRAAVKEIPAQNILIGVTHTHSAPDCYGFKGFNGKSGRSEKYLELVCTRMAEALHEAVTNLQPVRLKIATGEAKGKIAYNYYAPQLYDPRCTVIQLLDASGKPTATLVNYALHPEVLGNDLGICSPDLIGPLYDRLAEKGAGTGIFMNSAQGGMVTADNRQPDGKDARTWEECLRIGHLLADEALRIIAEAPEQPSAKLYCAARPLTLPVDSPMFRMLLKTLPGVPSGSMTNVTTQMNVINLGNAQILTIPGEALPNIGYYLKRKMHGENNLLFGLTNDAFGYMLTKEDFNSFKRYSYVSQTSLGERTGEILIAEGLKFVDECPRPEPLAAR
jgi:hypothetical protein